MDEPLIADTSDVSASQLDTARSIPEDNLAWHLWRRYAETPGVIPSASDGLLGHRLARWESERVAVLDDITRRYPPAELTSSFTPVENPARLVAVPGRRSVSVPQDVSPAGHRTSPEQLAPNERAVPPLSAPSLVTPVGVGDTAPPSPATNIPKATLPTPSSATIVATATPMIQRVAPKASSPSPPSVARRPQASAGTSDKVATAGIQRQAAEARAIAESAANETPLVRGQRVGPVGVPEPPSDAAQTGVTPAPLVPEAHTAVDDIIVRARAPVVQRVTAGAVRSGEPTIVRPRQAPGSQIDQVAAPVIQRRATAPDQPPPAGGFALESLAYSPDASLPQQEASTGFGSEHSPLVSHALTATEASVMTREGGAQLHQETRPHQAESETAAIPVQPALVAGVAAPGVTTPMEAPIIQRRRANQGNRETQARLPADIAGPAVPSLQTAPSPKAYMPPGVDGSAAMQTSPTDIQHPGSAVVRGFAVPSVTAADAPRSPGARPIAPAVRPDVLQRQIDYRVPVTAGRVNPGTTENVAEPVIGEPQRGVSLEHRLTRSPIVQRASDTSTANEPPAAELVQSPPQAPSGPPPSSDHETTLDLERLADEVTQIIERRLIFEREQRGL